MKQNEITINVMGVAGSGKTTIQLLINKLLTDNGFKVDVINNDFKDREHLNKYDNFNPQDRLNAVREKIEKITIFETQLGRPVKS